MLGPLCFVHQKEVNALPGRTELRSIRAKAEATNGTKVSPRFLWRGNGEMIKDSREVTEVEEQVGIFGGTDRSYTAKLFAEMDLAETPATFEQLDWLFQMSGMGTSGGGNRAGSAQGASGSTVVFTLPVPTGVAPITYSYTIEAGNGTGPVPAEGWTEVMEYALCTELKLSFTGGEAMMVSASLMGRQGTPTNAEGTFSNVGTLVTVEEILSGLGTAWLTPVGSGWGTGAVTPGNILAGEITFKPKWEPKYPVDAGVLYYQTAVFTGIDIEGELTLEAQPSGTFGAWGSTGQREKWRSEVAQLMQLTWRGGAIPTGTTYTSKELTIQLPFKYVDPPEWDDQNGNDIQVFKFVSKYNESSPTSGRGTVIIARFGTSEFAGA